MKPNKDPLDQRIDELLANRPLRAEAAFTARVLAATSRPSVRPQRTRLATVLKFALPLAAALALVFVLLHQPAEQATGRPSAPLSAAAAEEIFHLENGLEGLASFDGGDLPAGRLLDTFEILYLEI
jgi:hypothetical protein